MDRLPPFDALVAFEAAARRRSMTLAAADLGLTQSAVSHRIRRLEGFMGGPLLRRLNSGLSLTPSGEALMEGLESVLRDMTGLRALCLSAVAPERLRLGVGAALAQYWLMRRLPDFALAHPDVFLEMGVMENDSPGRAEDFDVRVLWVPASELRATTTQRPLFQERVFPVCHPSLLPAGFVPGDVRVLDRLPLLHKGPAGRGAAAEWSWPAWLERLGLAPRPRETLRFGSLGPAIAAAAEGAGVVLARTLLLHDALADGRLVRVLPPDFDLLSGKAYVVRWSAAVREDSRVRRLVDWLGAKAAETQAA